MKRACENLERLGMPLAVLNALMVAWNAFVFFVFLRVGVLDWLVLNVCSPSQIVAIAGLLSKKKEVVGVSIPLLLRFGVGGMLLFSWSGYMLQAQANHILMIITTVYLLYTTIKNEDKKQRQKMLVGLGIGVLLVLLIDFVVFPWYFANMSPRIIELLKDMGFANVK